MCANYNCKPTENTKFSLSNNLNLKRITEKFVKVLWWFLCFYFPGQLKRSKQCQFVSHDLLLSAQKFKLPSLGPCANESTQGKVFIPSAQGYTAKFWPFEFYWIEYFTLKTYLNDIVECCHNLKCLILFLACKIFLTM